MSYETAMNNLKAEMARYKAANDYVEAYVAKHPPTIQPLEAEKPTDDDFAARTLTRIEEDDN